MLVDDRPCTGCKYIVFRGQEIEIDEDFHEDERLSPDLVKLKWREEQIRSQQNNFKFMQTDNQKSKIESILGGKSHKSIFNSMNSRFVQPKSVLSYNLRDFSSTDVTTMMFSHDCAHTVWSGWLRKMDAGIYTIFYPSQSWWCILIVEHTELRLEFNILDASMASMKPDRSIVLDPSSQSRPDRSMLACGGGGSARLSIKERGSGLWHRLMCESVDEANRLLTCINAMLETLHENRGP